MTQQTQEQPVITRAGEGEARWWLGGLAELKLTAEQTGGRQTIVEVTDPPNAGSPFHVHYDDDETFFILEGSATFDVGDETFVAGPGDVVFGPRGVRHRYTTGPDGLRVLFIMNPGGFEGLVRDMSEPAQRRELPPPSDEEPDYEALQRIALAHRCEILE